MLELDRVKRHLRAQNKSERVDANHVQHAFRELVGIAQLPGSSTSARTSRIDQSPYARRASHRATRRGRARQPVAESANVVGARFVRLAGRRSDVQIAEARQQAGDVKRGSS
jgi:hypothetical protein